MIVDLDLQFGDVASALGLAPEAHASPTRSGRSTSSTPPRSRRTSPSTRRTSTCCARRSTPTEADDITIEQVERVLELLTESFKYVVIDTASGLDEDTLAALEFATDLLLISATDVPSIRAR